MKTDTRTIRMKTITETIQTTEKDNIFGAIIQCGDSTYKTGYIKNRKMRQSLIGKHGIEKWKKSGKQEMTMRVVLVK